MPERLDEVVPPQLRVIDLELCARDLDPQILHGDAVHLDADVILVVRDDVDLAADERRLQARDVGDIDDARLTRMDDPFLVDHVFSQLEI